MCLNLSRRLVFFLLFFIFSFAFQPLQAKITPNDVYSRIDLLEQHVDLLLAHENMEVDTYATNERQLKPMHVYQIVMASSDIIRRIQIQLGIRPFPIMSVAPFDYTPEDVWILVKVLSDQVKRIANKKQVRLYGSLNEFVDKTPTLVFERGVNLLVKLLALEGTKKVSPVIVNSEMGRAVTDAEYILVNIDPYSRYKINSPQSPKGLKPSDAYQGMMHLRHNLNEVRAFFKMPIIALPKDDGRTKQPLDVFIQSQIVIAELNLIKLATKTIKTTPLPVIEPGKTPSDVHQRAAHVAYLISQVSQLDKLKKQ